MSSKRNEISIRAIIRSIVESLGHLTRTGTSGWGTNQPINVKATKPFLGDIDAEDEGKKVVNAPVKVSRAFFAAQAIDEPAES